MEPFDIGRVWITHKGQLRLGEIGMSCEEKERLVIEYEATTGRFSEAVAELNDKLKTMPKEEYERLERAANEHRMKSEQARLALEQHIAAHGC